MKKTGKLLEKLGGILSAEKQAQLAKKKSLKKVLKTLRQEKNRLKDRLKTSQNEETRHAIESRLKIISLQRKKGLNLLKDLKKAKKKKI